MGQKRTSCGITTGCSILLAETKGFARSALSCWLCANRNDFATFHLQNLLVFEPRNFVSGSNPKFVIDDKNKMPKRASNFCGGDEGIRTLDTLASIPHFQCGALDQLCDVSGFFDYSASSSASGVSSAASSTPSVLSSTKVFSNSASISRNNGSSLVISKDASSPAVNGVSLYDSTNS